MSHNSSLTSQHVWKKDGPTLGCTKYYKPPASEKAVATVPVDPMRGYTGFLPRN